MPEPTTPADPASFLPGYDCGHAVGDTEGYRRGHVEGYTKGHADGRAEALAEVEASEAARDDALVRGIAAEASKAVPYATLADRRGQHDRADTQRRILRERDIA